MNMILPLNTLKQIESYSITTKASKSGRPHALDDVITLTFKQWWKFDTVYRVTRITTYVDDDEFVTIRSREAENLLEQLYDYMGDTFSEFAPVKKKATILTLVPSPQGDEETK